MTYFLQKLSCREGLEMMEMQQDGICFLEENGYETNKWVTMALRTMRNLPVAGQLTATKVLFQ